MPRTSGSGPSPSYRRVMIFVDGGYLRENIKRKWGNDVLAAGSFQTLTRLLIEHVNYGNILGELIRTYYYDAIVDEKEKEEREKQKLNSYTLIYTHQRWVSLVRSDGAEARKQRIQEIIRKVMSKLNQDEDVLLSFTVAELQYDYGLTQRTSIEYLEIGEKLQRYRLDKLNDRIKKINES